MIKKTNNQQFKFNFMKGNLKIEVYHYEGKKDHFKLLPETSQYLTEKQLIPNVGDDLTLDGRDGIKILGLNSTSLENIMTVNRRWFRYATADVAILVNYKAW